MFLEQRSQRDIFQVAWRSRSWKMWSVLFSTVFPVHTVCSGKPLILRIGIVLTGVFCTSFLFTLLLWDSYRNVGFYKKPKHGDVFFFFFSNYYCMNNMLLKLYFMTIKHNFTKMIINPTKYYSHVMQRIKIFSYVYWFYE